MFEGLSERMQGVFKELRGEGHLTDFHLEQALRQIRLSLLEADVALPVVRDFTARVKERAVGAKVTQQLSPAQEVTRIVRDELMGLLGGVHADLALCRANPRSSCSWVSRARARPRPPGSSRGT